MYNESFIGFFTKYFNWWNMMETTFGAVMGAVLGLGLWLNRRRIGVSSEPDVQPVARLAGRAAFGGPRDADRAG